MRYTWIDTVLENKIRGNTKLEVTAMESKILAELTQMKVRLLKEEKKGEAPAKICW